MTTDHRVQMTVEALNDQALRVQARLPRELTAPEHEALKAALGTAMQTAAGAAVRKGLLSHRRYHVEGTVLPTVRARRGEQTLHFPCGFIALEVAGDDALYPALIAATIVAIQLAINTACNEGFDIDVAIELASPAEVLALAEQIVAETLNTDRDAS